LQTFGTTWIPVEVGQEHPYILEISRHEVTLRDLPPSLHGATFVHLSDLHGGFANLEAVYEEAIAQVNAIEPDYIFFTGDYVDKRSAPANYPIQNYLRRFRAKQGMFGSLGNHDHRRGPEQAKRMLEQSGIRVVNNESIRLESGLWLAGVDDLHEGQPNIPRAFANLPTDQTSIVLSHNPRLIEKAKGRDIVILSGHTHGGQFRLRFPTPLMICYLHLRCWQVAGWYRRGKTRLYVNRGLGVTGKPYRINCPAEIGVFRMLPDSADAAKQRENDAAQTSVRAMVTPENYAGRK
jgi:predicted MPP superfamily phosphohydrolase